MGDLRLVVLTNKDASFYPTLGPFLARRDIVTALGGPLYDDDGKIWFVALGGETIAGFGAIETRGEDAHFTADWVQAPYRRQGLHKRLIAERIEYCRSLVKPPKRLTVTATIAGAFGYRSAGFAEEKTRARAMKNFVRMERKL